MAKAKRFSHEELQRDEVAETLQGVVDKIVRYRVRLIVMGVTIVLVVALGAAWLSRRSGLEREANTRLRVGLNLYGQLLNQTDPQSRIDLRTAVVENVAQIIEALPGSPLARYALYLKACALYTTDQFSEAQADFEQCLRDAANDTDRARAEIGLGYTFENASFFLESRPDETPAQRQERMNAQLAKLDDALAHYERAAELTSRDSYLHYYGLLGSARIAELTSRNDRAVELLQRIIDERGALESTPVEPPPDIPNEDPLIRSLRQYIGSYEAQLGLAATAKFRLERLQARMNRPINTLTSQVVVPPPAGIVTIPTSATAPTSGSAATSSGATTPTASATPAVEQP
jgi:tetratricopeptide (TPR) repeat protein